MRRFKSGEPVRRFKSFSVGTSDDTNLLDAQVNEWLRKHEDTIEIVETQVRTQFGVKVGGRDYINITVAIWYDELEPGGDNE
jgi:hypothetical protein